MSSLVIDDVEIASAKQLVSLSAGVTPLLPGAECFGCAWSREADYFAWSCGQRKVKVIRWDRLLTGACNLPNTRDAVTIDAGGFVHSIAFCSRQTPNNLKDTSKQHDVTSSDVTLVTGLKNGRIRTWDAKTGALKLELCDHSDTVTGLGFAPKGPFSSLLVSSSLDGTLKLWDMEDDGNMLKSLKANSTKFLGCCWSPDGVTLASVGNYHSVHLWNMKSRKMQYRLDGHRNNVTKCEFSPDGILLATSSYDSRVIIWNVQLGEALRYLEHCSPPLSAIYAGGANSAYVRSVSFSNDGYHVATVCDDGFIRFWNIFDNDVPVQAANVDNALVCCFSPGGSMLAVGTRSGELSIWLSPMRVASLQHICRITIRRMVSTADVDSLHSMPMPLRRFLQYSNPYTNLPVSICG